MGKQRSTKQTGQAAARDDAAQPSAENRPAQPSTATERARRQTASEAAQTHEPRSGEDVRQRGWFWHWNGIITQYAPLIGLKGVGLLNSYTAWTDRREHSPHRGYAFPSQRAEAAFYGEDRAELITINKILVALDLIEIRKEMVEKVDEKGRRWKVPHNFYRVKDRSDGLDLTTEDVLRVAELAARDRAVYRYVRKVFSPRFAPIDRHNIWHQILAEVQHHPTWQKLAEKTAKQEARASARTRAGHRSRTKPETEPDRDTGMTSGHLGDEAFVDTEQHGDPPASAATKADAANSGSPPEVARANQGSAVDAEPPNQGSRQERTTSAAESNSDPPSVVEPGNTTYYQEATTTTTTTIRARDDDTEREWRALLPTDEERSTGSMGPLDRVGAEAVERDPVEVADPAGAGLAAPLQPGTNAPGERAPERGAGETGGWGPLGDPSPLVVSLFEAANDRKSTRLERILLSELERDAAPAAASAGSTGADWVAAALREAVGSGSSFVAPKRLREIIVRWAAEGDGPRGDGRAPAGSDGATSDQSVNHQAPVFWLAAVEYLKRALEEETHARLFASSTARRLSAGRVEVTVASPWAAAKLDREYRQLVERQLARELGRSVGVSFVTIGDAAPLSKDNSDDTDDGFGGAEDVPGDGREATGDADADDTIRISPADEERGRQLWQAVVHDLAAAIPAWHLQRLKGVTPLGQDERGAIILGAPNQLAVQLLARYRLAVEQALSTFLGQPATIEVVGPGGWVVAA